MKSEGTRKADSTLISRILAAMVIILATWTFYSILFDLWQGESISIMKQIIATILVLVVVVTVGFVIVQRLQMRKNENFRREKW